MKIGVFSKFVFAGGSEFRCVEMCNGISKHTEHEAFLLGEGKIHPKVIERVSSGVHVVEKSVETPQSIYDMDHVLVVNTDSKEFTTPGYWRGESERHRNFVDLTKIPSMSFLFNFIVSPARHLNEIEKAGPRVRIITANERFLNEIAEKDKHESIRHIPRIMLESPIDPESVSVSKVDPTMVRIGKHSHSLENKWNLEQVELMKRINSTHGDRVFWDFMGCSDQIKEEMKGFGNCVMRDAFSISVRDYLEGIHVFLFYISWKRQEPWSRSVAEAMASGCPVLATDTDSGNKQQVISGCNGFLCTDLDAFERNLKRLLDDPDLLKRMSKSAICMSRFFSTEWIVKKFIRFVED